MLPDRDSKDFPLALKKAREDKNISYSELARAIGISPIMPKKYESNVSKTRPSQTTWRKLNSFFQEGSAVEKSLSDSSIEDIVKELRNRGASSVHIIF